jgi:hypothetical protein
MVAPGVAMHLIVATAAVEAVGASLTDDVVCAIEPRNKVRAIGSS